MNDEEKQAAIFIDLDKLPETFFDDIKIVSTEESIIDGKYIIYAKTDNDLIIPFFHTMGLNS